MRIDVVSIFPDYLRPLELSLPGRARSTGLLELAVHDLRDWTHDRHRTVDDAPLGGGAGMVMRPEPWGLALDDVVRRGRAAGLDGGPHLLVPSPAGTPLTQAVAAELDVHPQTVRYRMGQVREAFGDSLDDPEVVLALTLALGVGDAVG